MSKTSVLIVDDHPLMREALSNTIEPEQDFYVAGQAVNGLQAVNLTDSIQPEIILMDLFMPVMDGIEATRLITTRYPQIKVLIITSSDEDEKVTAAIRAGAAGYILKDASRDRILAGLREVRDGKYFIPPDVSAKLVNALKLEQTPADQLTARETEVLNLVSQGFSNAEIAAQLVLSEGTVRVHISNMASKLNLQNRSQLAIYAHKRDQAERLKNS